MGLGAVTERAQKRALGHSHVPFLDLAASSTGVRSVYEFPQDAHLEFVHFPLELLGKLNLMVYTLLCLASFLRHCVFDIHLYYYM